MFTTATVRRSGCRLRMNVDMLYNMPVLILFLNLRSALCAVQRASLQIGYNGFY